uniref:HSPC141 n=1 Tax=Homo sapiens TaxID=9606 RepID=Q9P019_HUMAN|nr:HSPC141 [Homo sapiens]
MAVADLALIPDVDIDSDGVFKYVLIRVHSAPRSGLRLQRARRSCAATSGLSTMRTSTTKCRATCRSKAATVSVWAAGASPTRVRTRRFTCTAIPWPMVLPSTPFQLRKSKPSTPTTRSPGLTTATEHSQPGACCLQQPLQSPAFACTPLAGLALPAPAAASGDVLSTRPWRQASLATELNVLPHLPAS